MDTTCEPKHGEEEVELAALFRDELPDKLPSDLLALAHLSDVEDPPPEKGPSGGPIRRKRISKKSNPYRIDPEEELNNQMKELDFRTKAWKPFKPKK